MMKEKKKNLVVHICVLSGRNERLQLKSCNILVRKYLFLKNYVISEGVVSHNVLNTINSSPVKITLFL